MKKHLQDHQYGSVVDIKDKTIQIKDNLNQFCFHVSLKTEDDGYTVTVDNKKNGIQIFKEKYADKCYAQNVLDGFVKDYAFIVKSQCRDLRDINLYSEKIEYTVTDPNRCFNCRFCDNDKDRKYLVCTNKESFVFDNMNCDHHDRFDCHDHSEHIGGYCHNHNYNIHFMNSCPRVDPFGLCKNYIRRGIEDGELVDVELDKKIDAVVDNKIQKKLNDIGTSNSEIPHFEEYLNNNIVETVNDAVVQIDTIYGFNDKNPDGIDDELGTVIGDIGA